MNRDTQGTGADRANPQGRVLDYEHTVRVARERFLAEGRLDMEELAAELAVSRATLYRVVPGRDRLLGDVLAPLAAQAVSAAAEETTARGLDRILETGSRFRDGVSSFEALRRFAAAEPLTLATVLFTHEGMHQSLVAAWRGVLLDVESTDGLALPLPAEHLAEIVVRIGGSVLYADLVSEQPGEVDLAAVLVRALFAQGTSEGPETASQL